MKNKILIGSIFILAAFLRFFLLDKIPPHPSLDEVSIGYNAYSIAQTGKDEFGNLFPILLRAYDDWRPALYVYLVIPSIKVFGLTPFAVRAPSALLSLFSVLATYFIAKELFATTASRKFGKNTNIIALLSMLLLAISPWHVYISRLGHEVNAGISFFVFGSFFFLKAINSSLKKKYEKTYLPLSAVFFALSFNSYQSMKVFIPAFSILLFILFYEKVIKDKRLFGASVAVAIIIISPILIASLKPQALIRYQATNVFQNMETRLESSAQTIERNKEQGYIQTTIFDNRRIEYVDVVLEAYLSHYNPVYLFTNTGNESFKIPQFGLLYIFMLPALIYGAICIIQEKHIRSKTKMLLLFWSALAVLPGAISNGYPHAMRTIQLLPLPQLVAAVGGAMLYNHIAQISSKKIVPFAKLAPIGVIIFFSAWFAHSYFINFKHELSHQFQDGVLESLEYAEKNKDKYESIIVSNKNNLLQSYMFYLFFTKYDPSRYQKQGGTISGGFAQTHLIDKYLFSTDSASSKAEPNTLYITNSEETPQGDVTNVKKILNGNNDEVIWISESKTTNELKE